MLHSDNRRIADYLVQHTRIMDRLLVHVSSDSIAELLSTILGAPFRCRSTHTPRARAAERQAHGVLLRRCMSESCARVLRDARPFGSRSMERPVPGQSGPLVPVAFLQQENVVFRVVCLIDSSASPDAAVPSNAARVLSAVIADVPSLVGNLQWCVRRCVSCSDPGPGRCETSQCK
jgi:hypothetical protein